MKSTTAILLTVLQLFILLSLQACITPHLSRHNNVCKEDGTMLTTQQNNSKATQKNCHFYGRNTPYDRKKQPNTQSYELAQVSSTVQTSSHATFIESFDTPLLSIGDRISINVLNGDEFSGNVEINADGFIYLPYLPPLKAQGISIASLKADIKQLLIDEQLMINNAIRLSIVPLKWAPIQVSVSGAVFEPGLHKINHKSDTEITDDNGGHSGDQAAGRSVYMALRASGGISPNANISKVTITRGQRVIEIDLSGVINGNPVPHLTLIAEDHIHVPHNTHFDDSLARPSKITVPGIRVIISNLTQPATSNSQSAVDTEATRFPYGSRLLTGVIGGNCVGGAQSTSAGRHVLLITKNPLTQEIDVIERSIDNLIAQSWQPDMNPILLPGNGIACYDSGITNLREIARTIREIIVPVTLLGIL